MIEEKKYIQKALENANYIVFQNAGGILNCMAFEDTTKFGFIFLYSETSALLKNWKKDGDKIVDKFKFQIRNSGDKSWNIYLVFLSLEKANEKERVQLSKIEEDLTGTRKIAQSVVSDEDGIRGGLLSLLEIQNPPVIEPVDIEQEIRKRTSELPSKAIDAFFNNAQSDELIRLMGVSHEA